MPNQTRTRLSRSMAKPALPSTQRQADESEEVLQPNPPQSTMEHMQQRHGNRFVQRWLNNQRASASAVGHVQRAKAAPTITFEQSAVSHLIEDMYRDPDNTDAVATRQALAEAIGFPLELIGRHIDPVNPYTQNDGFEIMMYLVGDLVKDLAQAKTDGTLESEPADMMERRLNAMKEYISTRQRKQASGEETGDKAIDPKRSAIVTLAVGQIGKVFAKQGGAMEGKRKTRVGWQFLDEIFETSYGGRTGNTPDLKYNVGAQNAVKYLMDGLEAWCGHFANWAYKKSGLGTADWVRGSGISNMQTLPAGTRPKPGDMLYIPQPYQHHAIVMDVEGDKVRTIDGNTGGDGGATGGAIDTNTRPITSSLSFYRPPGLE